MEESEQKVTRLVTKREQQAREVVEEFPGLRNLYYRFCEDCQDSLRVGQKPCGEGHNIREMTQPEQDAEMIYKMDYQ